MTKLKYDTLRKTCAFCGNSLPKKTKYSYYGVCEKHWVSDTNGVAVFNFGDIEIDKIGGEE